MLILNNIEIRITNKTEQICLSHIQRQKLILKNLQMWIENVAFLDMKAI